MTAAARRARRDEAVTHAGRVIDGAANIATDDTRQQRQRPQPDLWAARVRCPDDHIPNTESLLLQIASVFASLVVDSVIATFRSSPTAFFERCDTERAQVFLQRCFVTLMLLYLYPQYFILYFLISYTLKAFRIRLSHRCGVFATRLGKFRLIVCELLLTVSWFSLRLCASLIAPDCALTTFGRTIFCMWCANSFTGRGRAG